LSSASEYLQLLRPVLDQLYPVAYYTHPSLYITISLPNHVRTSNYIHLPLRHWGVHPKRHHGRMILTRCDLAQVKEASRNSNKVGPPADMTHTGRKQEVSRRVHWG